MKVIDGILLKQMLISGSNNLYNHYPEIDALNVFPVPDGDTGMNMNLTLSSGSKEIANRNDSSVYEIAKAFSKGLLMGARGNSGVITSQIFRGFAQSLQDKTVIKPKDFADALMQGKDVAYKAVMRPVEGTILTVIRETAQALSDSVSDDMRIDEVMALTLKEANASLKRTPELLPILKEVGVVDSGGAGLVRIFEGFQSAIAGKVVEKSQATAAESNQPMAGSEVEGDEFGYCTEFIMRLGPSEEKKPFVEKRFINVLQSHGNSLAVVTDEDIVKVHVHTMNPGSILTYAQNFGEFIKIKVENMTEQHEALQGGAVSKEKDIDIPVKEDKPLDEYALIAVSVGKGIDEMFKECGVKEIVSGGQTMNPATEDFVAAIKRCHAKNIFILPNNSNIVMAAAQACDVILEQDNINARVIPSKTIPQGLVSAVMFNPDLTPDDNFKEMKAALKTVKSGSITFAIKDTDIEGVHVTKDYFMGIDGKKIITCQQDRKACFKELVDSMITPDSSIITVLVGEGVEPDEKDELQGYLEENHSDVDVDIREGGQPVYSYLIGVE